MDEQVQVETQQVTPPQSTSFSVQPKQKSSGSKWLVIFIVLLILGGAGIFFFTKVSNDSVEATPTPTFRSLPVEEKETATPTPLKTTEPSSRSDVSIEIQNGTGITGEAAFLQGKLKGLGYSDIKVGNADSTDNTDTTVTFSKSLSQSNQDEIKTLLEGIFKNVVTKTSSTAKTDVVVVTGSRSGQTVKSSPSATPKVSPSATPKSSASPSATPKATATP